MKRHLPIRNRERKINYHRYTSIGVYNEWGAVLQRQDELAIQKQQEDQQKLKVRQHLYKNELDSQLMLQQHKSQV
jgi:hypothetical protein